MSEAPTGHLTAAETAAYLEGAVAPESRARMDAHLEECAQCRDEIVEAGRVVARVLRPGRNVRRVWIPAAIAAALVFMLVRPESIRDPITIAHREAPVTAVVLPIPVEPIGAVDSVPALRWHSVAGADGYHVRVFASDGSVLWERATADTSAVLDSLRLDVGRTYSWDIAANAEFGRRALSEQIEFSLRPQKRR